MIEGKKRDKTRKRKCWEKLFSQEQTSDDGRPQLNAVAVADDEILSSNLLYLSSATFSVWDPRAKTAFIPIGFSSLSIFPLFISVSSGVFLPISLSLSLSYIFMLS